MQNRRANFFMRVLLILTAIILYSCGQQNTKISDENHFLQLSLQIPVPESVLRDSIHFNAGLQAPYVSITRKDRSRLSGWTSTNRKFLEQIFSPVIRPHLESLKKRPLTEVINELALTGFSLYRYYFGTDFYRWAGDIFDLDDPQEEGIRYRFAFGLDCSGFTTMPYELVVYFGLMDAESEQAIFSSKGFEWYCKTMNFQDQGGREGGGNHYRLDTSELARLGREIFTVPHNGRASASDIKLLQPGDIVGRSGHFGIIVELENRPYYIESGGWVLPENGGRPCPAEEALRVFARTGSIMVRRVLPDRN